MRYLKTILSGRSLALALLVLLLGMRVLDPVLIESIRNQSFDLFQRMKPRDLQPQPISIIDIDEKSLRDVGQWPWPRTKMAELVGKLTQAGVAAIAFDIVFSEKDRLSPAVIAEDNANLPEELRAALRALPSNEIVFAEALRRARVIVGQTNVRRAEDNTGESKQIRDVQHAFLGQDPKPFLLKFPELVQNRPELEEAASGRGVFSVRPDVDGVFRRVPLVMLVEDKIRLSLSTELLRVATGGGAFAVRTDEAGISALVVARQQIQTDKNGMVWPYFSPSSPNRFVPAGDVLSGTVAPERLRGHLVLVGTSAIGLEDYRTTPMSAQMAGVEIHAQVLENILAGSMLVRPNYAVAVELVVTTVLGLLVIILIPFLGAVWTIVAAVVLLASYVVGSYFAFDLQRLLIDPTFPAMATLSLIILMSIGNYLREERQRQQIRSAFGQYVSPDLVEQLSNEPDKLTLGGETKELSILFSDVRGFTSISESFKDNPAGLTVLMNRFLTELSNAILKHGGTIDKFMGDAVMAFWNAPLDREDHCEEACYAAIEMIGAVEALNAQVKAEVEASDDPNAQYHEINVGIGINTGSCVVGNMGSDVRFDYTALGDSVNLASRLEGQSKPYGVSIVLGDATAQRVRDKFALLELDLIRVKGKNEPERIFGLFGGRDVLENKDFQAARALNKTMVTAYRSQDWSSAFDAVDLLREVNARVELGLDDYLFLFETRIAEFRANPPGKAWDGVYSATSK